MISDTNKQKGLEFANICVFDKTMDAPLNDMKNFLVPFIDKAFEGTNYWFMQDNDPKHTSRLATAFYELPPTLLRIASFCRGGPLCSLLLLFQPLSMPASLAALQDCSWRLFLVTSIAGCWNLKGGPSLRKCPHSPPNHCQLPSLQILQNDQSDLTVGVEDLWLCWG